MLAAVARKDYDDRRRQAQGIAKARAAGLYRGRREDTERSAAILQMLKKGQSWNDIVTATGCSSCTLRKVAKRMTQKSVYSRS
jgi:DNA invertase Pin-like site-specific DNA recombinase